MVGRGNREADHKLASLPSKRSFLGNHFRGKRTNAVPHNNTLAEKGTTMAVFTEEFTRMRQDFDQAQADRDQLFQDTREHVQNLAQGVKDQLAGFRQNMREMHDEIAETASQVRTELREMSTDLHTGGNIFRKGSSPEHREARKASNLLAARLCRKRHRRRRPLLAPSSVAGIEKSSWGGS